MSCTFKDNVLMGSEQTIKQVEALMKDRNTRIVMPYKKYTIGRDVTEEE